MYGIENLQIIQEEIDKIVVKIVLNDEFTETMVPKLETNFRELLGDEFEIEIKIVDSINISDSMKRRLVISKISEKF
jgi:phenylacetate-coenzyme A ligase PaaK-like adenylate-forming protein